MRLHKIPGVDMGTCCAEQKLAYNVAFCDSRMGLDYALSHARRIFEGKPRIDVDAVCRCIRNGFAAYVNGRHHVMSSYAEVARAFPLETAEQ